MLLPCAHHTETACRIPDTLVAGECSSIRQRKRMESMAAPSLCVTCLIDACWLRCWAPAAASCAPPRTAWTPAPCRLEPAHPACSQQPPQAPVPPDHCLMSQRRHHPCHCHCHSAHSQRLPQHLPVCLPLSKHAGHCAAPVLAPPRRCFRQLWQSPHCPPPPLTHCRLARQQQRQLLPTTCACC